MGSINIKALRDKHPGKSDAQLAAILADSSNYHFVVRYKSRSASDFTDFGCCATAEELSAYRTSDACKDVEVIYPTSLTPSGQQVLNYQLGHAIIRGDINAVRQMVQSGGDVNAKHDGHHGPPIMLATRWEGTTEMGELLLSLGADVNYRGADGNTPLHWSAQHGSEVAVEFLLAKGAKIDVRNQAGETPIGIATAQNKTKVVRLLEEAKGSREAALKGHIEPTAPSIASVVTVSKRWWEFWK